MTASYGNTAALRAEIVQVGRLMYEKSLVIGRDGNISVRLDENHILCTPSGLCKGMMSEDQLVVINLNGERVDSPTPANRDLRPTSEMTMHLEAYKQRPDIKAVVHAHPPYAITLSIAGISLTDCMLPEAILFLGIIKTTPYATPSGIENALAIKDVITQHDAIVLERHGSLVVGQSPLDAFYKTETLEQIARITYMLQPLGGGEALPPHQVEKLMALRGKFGTRLTSDTETFCEACGVCQPLAGKCQHQASSGEGQLVDLITKQVLAQLSKTGY